jgi:hypothetical protein
MATSETQSKIAQAARELTDIEDELREVHGEPVAELPSMTVFADDHGHELSEIADTIDGVSRGDVSEWMHEQARGVYGRDEATGTGDPWSVSDPVVVLHD